jgi:hypothetical protein
MRCKAAMVTLLVLLACGRGRANCPSSHQSEQREFSAEESGVKRPVPIPESVWATLREDELVQGVLEDEGIPVTKMPASWFSASAIHLSDSGRADLIVMAEGRLRGANVITFWVFRYGANGYELVLTAPAHDLIVKNTRWKGYRDIELVSATADQFSRVLLRFDGKRYGQFKTSSEPIR